ncbi:hypothetical protein ABFY41_11160 [Acinetobacter haemolyticus]|uniref:hypothetical protein n=1 Tax=Acinetobacter haemolyticus TaxID=29430 RepID=UPI003D230B16
MEIDTVAIFNTRKLIGLSTTEAGQLVHVTKRTWEKWEAGDSKMPKAKAELFLAKIIGEISEDRELLVVVNESGVVIDVVSNDNFLSIEKDSENYHIIKSLAVQHKGGQPYIFKTKLDNSLHSDIITKAKTWKSQLD